MLDRIHAEERQYLNDLMADADLLVEFAMNAAGRVPTVLFIHGPDGRAMFSPDPKGGERAKMEFPNIARLICVAQEADAAVVLSEAGVTKAALERTLDFSKFPAPCGDRQEMLVMMGETRSGCQQRLLPIERDANGKFMFFGQEQRIETERVDGRLANLLPDEYPNASERELAKAELTRHGVDFDEKQQRRRRRSGMERGM
jgi:hypothetical protein